MRKLQTASTDHASIACGEEPRTSGGRSAPFHNGHARSRHLTWSLALPLLAGVCGCRTMIPVRDVALSPALGHSSASARNIDAGFVTASVDTDGPLPRDEQARDSLPQEAAPAQEYYGNIYRPFELSIGGVIYGSFDTSVRVSTPVILGALLDLEDLLGVDSSTSVGRLDASYAFNRRHRVDLAYYDIRRSGTTTILSGLEIGDVVIPPGGVRTEFNTEILKLSYRYNFVRDCRTAIGASFGLHTMRIDSAFAADTVMVEEGFDALAPLPLIGLHAQYALTHKWRLTAEFETLYVEYDNLDGFITDSKVALDHDTFKHLGWGIGLNSFNLNMGVDGKDNNLRGEIEYGYVGLMIYLRTFF